MLAVLLLCSSVYAQDAPQKNSVHVWLDAFYGQKGAVIYPQYGWSLVPKSFGKIEGSGFVERASPEPLLTNHQVVFTPGKKQSLFSVHAEVGALPHKGLGFFQVGPRVNLHEVSPRIKKKTEYLFVAFLPKLAGIRQNNILVSGETKRLKISKGLDFSAEVYRRFAKEGGFGEYWGLIHPHKTKHFGFGIFVLQSESGVSVGVGSRIALF
jgi:hypothetical protein